MINGSDTTVFVRAARLGDRSPRPSELLPGSNCLEPDEPRHADVGRLFEQMLAPQLGQDARAGARSGPRSRRARRPSDVLETRLQQVQAEQMVPIDLVAAFVAVELQRREDRLLARRHKQARFRDPERSLDSPPPA